MKIYLATSWRNHKYEHTRDFLIALGNLVYDFKNTMSAFNWQDIDDSYPWTADKIEHNVGHPLATRGFKSDKDAIDDCEAFVLLLPCGRSAHWEFGYAVGIGKPTIVFCYGNDKIEPEVVYAGADWIETTLIGLKHRIRCIEVTDDY